MGKAARQLLGLVLLVAGVLLCAYGLFAILYRGDSGGGDTYVTVSGHELDAGLVGAVALLFGALLVFGGFVFARRDRRVGERS